MQLWRISASASTSFGSDSSVSCLYTLTSKSSSCSNDVIILLWKYVHNKNIWSINHSKGSRNLLCAFHQRSERQHLPPSYVCIEPDKPVWLPRVLRKKGCTRVRWLLGSLLSLEHCTLEQLPDHRDPTSTDIQLSTSGADQHWGWVKIDKYF